MHLWLIRHAQSEANVGRVTTDFTGVRLTPRGERQAEVLATIVTERPDRVVCSPFLRTQQTAAPTLAKFPGLSAVTLPVHEFTYLCADRCRDTSAAERHPMVQEYWQRLDPYLEHGPSAESFAAFCARVRDFLDVARGWDGFTLVFTHEMFIRATVWAVMYGACHGTADEMTRFHGLRTAFPIPNASYLPVESRNGRLWLGGIEYGHLVRVGD